MKNRTEIENTVIKDINKQKITLLTAAIAGVLVPNISANATDLEIYSPQKTSSASIMLMLDTSGSMGVVQGFDSIDTDYGVDVDGLNDGDNCTQDGNTIGTYRKNAIESIALFNDDGTNVVTQGGSNELINYTVSYCALTAAGQTAFGGATNLYDRLSRLKRGLIPIFANPLAQLQDPDFLKTKELGFGTFALNNDGNLTGLVRHATVKMDLENRRELIRQVSSLNANGGTPSANAYAEAGAYMLGTTTFKGSTDDSYYTLARIDNGGGGNTTYSYVLNECDSVVQAKTSSTVRANGDSTDSVIDIKYCSTGTTYTAKDTSANSFVYRTTAQLLTIANSSGLAGLTQQTGLSFDGLIDDVEGYFESGGQLYFYGRRHFNNTNVPTFSGFLKSDDDAKKEDEKTYKSPIVTENPECHGYGVYFLTDGSANSSGLTTASTLMNNSLPSTAKQKVSSQCPVTGNITNTNTDSQTASAWTCMGEYAKLLKDKTANGKGVPIQTATVGFGETFASLNGQFDLDNGHTDAKPVYNCNVATSQDARNLCHLGNRKGGYGEGGFTYVQNSNGIENSIIQFFNQVGTGDSTRISAGIMSVPLDQINSQQSRGVAYLPMIEPNPGATTLWQGNLKKYKVAKGTIVGVDSTATSMKPVFSGKSGQFSTNTYDYWKEDTSSDLGKLLVGGAFDQILNNRTSKTDPTPRRNVFVNNLVVTEKDGVVAKNYSLQPVKVAGTANNYKPSGFDSLAISTDTTKNKKAKTQLIKFMGFLGLDDSKPVVDGTKLTGVTLEPSYKILGGVLHSLPQLITTSISIEQATGKFDNATREDYLIYGSMDGALHMLNDETGQEEFTFVPKEILELQASAITGGSADSGQPYGVDAPWNIHASYDFTSTEYKANQLIAMGGLRMGGSTYYALDITNTTTPKMVYSVGSNYANTLVDSTTALSGKKNGEADVDYAKMGQSWGKPSVGYVMKGGKRTMVNFLAGGYDMGYEKNDYTPTEAKPAQGNGVYMVKVGEVEENKDTKGNITSEKVNFTGAGDLLWSTHKTSVKDMNHSIVAQVRVLDSNNDGLTDHIYFADLGGQVWRADISNNKDTTDFNVDRVQKVLDVSDRAAAQNTEPGKEASKEAAPRFYERPVITFDRIKLNNDSSAKIKAFITVGTGNRSRPVNDQRTAATSDALYTFMDKDIAGDMFCYESANPNCKASDITEKLQEVIKIGNLTELKHTADDANIKTAMLDGTKQGWFMPLNYWHTAGSTGAPSKDKIGIKMLSQPDAIGSFLYVSRYNPNAGGTAKKCSAGIIGSTQVERLCLPYGNCTNGSKAETKVWTNYVVKETGLGVVDNILTQVNPGGTDSSLIGILDTHCEGDECNAKEFCPDGDGGAGCVSSIDSLDFLDINNDQVLNPLAWMEH